MSKKQKHIEIKSTPEIYHGLDITKDTKAHVTEDDRFTFFIFDSRQACHIIKEYIQKQWDGLNSFLEMNKSTIETYHENFFRCSPPKDQPIEVTAQYCWAWIINRCVDRRTNQVPVSASGRKSTIGTCEYRLGKCKEPQLKTPQANTCYRFLTESLASDKAVKTDADNYITEEHLRKYVEDHATELHTRQDPWRIFQYYRPELMKQQLLTRK